MTLEGRIEALVKLEAYLKANSETLQGIVHQTYLNNRWFTKENTRRAIQAICENFLKRSLLEKWLDAYQIPADSRSARVALILAGNIPLVGFHDVLCVFLAGHRALIKLSEKDKFLLPHFIAVLGELEEKTREYFQFAERLNGFDAVIATGSNNSTRYFEAYFGKYPNIIRKNRNAVAVLTGKESTGDLRSLGKDVFEYFGLGCRNVSKLYLPAGYDFEPLLKVLHEYNEVVLHDKYKNNFDYGYALLILNKIPYQANGCIQMIEDEALPSRIAQLHYEYYNNEEDLKQKLKAKAPEIQCIIGDNQTEPGSIPFGESQNPGLNDYADGVDTMKFLLKLY